MAARPGMQRIELVDEVDADDVPGVPGWRRDRGAAQRRRRWPWFVAVLLVVGGLAVTQALVSAHGRAVDARLAAIPGLVARTDQTLAPVWSMSDDQRRFVTSAVRFGDEAVGLVTHDDGSRSVVALDVASETPLWTYPLGGPDALRARAGDDIVQPGSCTAVPGPTSRVACYVTDGVAVQTGGELFLELRDATAGRLAVLDADGTPVVDRAAPVGRTFGVTRSALLLAGVGQGQHGVVVAQDLLTGAARWQWSTPDLVVGTGVSGARLAFQPFALGDEVAVAEPAGRVTVLDETGRVVQDAVLGVSGWTTSRDSLVLAVGTDDTTIVRPHAAAVELSGSPVRLVADDGSLGTLALTSADGRLHAYDATTGTPRWSVAVQPSSRVLALHGQLYLIGAGAFLVLDGRTGATVARVPAPAGTTFSPPMSDGRHVLVAQIGAAGDPGELTAYGFAGKPAWTIGLSPGTSTVGQLGRTIVAYDDSGLEVLGTRG